MKLTYKISYALFLVLFLAISTFALEAFADSCGYDAQGYIITSCDDGSDKDNDNNNNNSNGSTDSSERPTVHIIGSDEINLTVGDHYNDAGAVAYDPQDGNITYKIKTSYNYNTHTAGNYNVTYRVTDSDGNESGAVRRIIVSPASTADGGGTVKGDSTEFCDIDQNVTTETGITDGELIRASGDIDVYIVKYVCNKKFKRLILSPHVFESYGHLDWDDVKTVNKSTLDSFTTSNLVRATSAGDQKVYRLTPNGDTGEKRWITSGEVFLDNGWDWEAIYTINTTDRDAYTTGNPIN